MVGHICKAMRYEFHSAAAQDDVHDLTLHLHMMQIQDSRLNAGYLALTNLPTFISTLVRPRKQHWHLAQGGRGQAGDRGQGERGGGPGAQRAEGRGQGRGQGRRGGEGGAGPGQGAGQGGGAGGGRGTATAEERRMQPLFWNLGKPVRKWKCRTRLRTQQSTVPRRATPSRDDDVVLQLDPYYQRVSRRRLRSPTSNRRRTPSDASTNDSD